MKFSAYQYLPATVIFSHFIIAPAAAGWELQWTDSFDGTSVDWNNWTPQIQANYNNEVQCYTADDSSANKNYDVSNGTLKIIARRQNINCPGLGGASKSWTSGRLNSKDKQEFLYGRIEARIRFHNLEQGTWPAFWALENRIHEAPIANDNDSVSWPNPGAGEIDIWEWYAHNPGSYITNFFNTSQCGSEIRYSYPGGAPDVQQWHTYAMEWSQDSIKFFIDNTLVTSHDISSCAQYKEPMFILLNVAMGGTLGGSIDPVLNQATMEVDYVSHYRDSDTTPTDNTDLTIFGNFERSDWKAWDCCGGSTPIQVTDPDTNYGQTMQFQVNNNATVVGFTGRSSDGAANGNPLDVSEMANTGLIEFDLKITALPTDPSADWKLKLESNQNLTHAEISLTQSEENHTALPVDTWQHYSFKLSDLATAGLDLSAIDLIMIFPEWGNGSGAVFQLDNVKFTESTSPVNTSPAITSTPADRAQTGVRYEYTLTATDADNDNLTFSAGTLPAWLSFDAASGLLSGTPGTSDVGQHSIVLQASDGTDSVDQSFILSVWAATTPPPPTNTAPVITSTPTERIQTGVRYEYILTATDSNGDSLTFSAEPLPAWLSFDLASRTLSGTPAEADVGQHIIVLRVSDGTNSIRQSFNLTVWSAPIITSTPPKQIQTGNHYQYTLTATDADGDDLTFSAETLPAWLSFNPISDVLSGTPGASDVGQHLIVLHVSDNSSSTEQSFDLTVQPAPEPVNISPVISSVPTNSTQTGTLYEYILKAADADGDNLTFSAITLPAWLSFNSASGLLSGIPNASDVGQHNIVLQASDGSSSTKQSFDLTVKATPAPMNTSPVITSVPTSRIQVGTLYEYTLKAADADGDNLTFSATTLPAWLLFDPASGLLSGTPDETAVGQHSIALRANDGINSTEQSFNLTVSATPTTDSNTGGGGSTNPLLLGLLAGLVWLRRKL